MLHFSLVDLRYVDDNAIHLLHTTSKKVAIRRL